MRESTTGAETDTYPKDGENSRSSKLFADLAKKTRKLCAKKARSRTYIVITKPKVVLQQGSVRKYLC